MLPSEKLCAQIVSQAGQPGPKLVEQYARIEDMMDRASALTIGMDMRRYQRLSDLERLNFPLPRKPITREILAWELYGIFIQAKETGSDSALARFLDRLHLLNLEIVARLREQEQIYNFDELNRAVHEAWDRIPVKVQNDFARWLGKVYLSEPAPEGVLRQFMRRHSNTYSDVLELEGQHHLHGRRLLQMFGIGQSTFSTSNSSM